MATVNHVQILARSDIRTDAERWQAVNRLVDRLHQIVHANARIDATAARSSQYGRTFVAARFEKILTQLQRDVDSEITRLTVDGLKADLRDRQRADAAKDRS